MFDRSLLAPADFEFVVITDTHYMLDPEGRQVEFQCRLLQSDRAGVAMTLAQSLETPLAMHIGDVAQEFPDTPRFQQAIDEAKDQMARIGFQARHVAGNQDVGDKPDPTMPGLPVTSERVAQFHEEFGPSWYSFDQGGVHFVVINTGILNTELSEAHQQREWLTHDLAEHQGRRTFLFLHLPPYLWDEHEPHLGHYDNIGQPDREWLLELIRRYGIEQVMCGHVHFSFYDRIGPARYLTVVSPSFTRPGFSHIFTGPAPPERGRDDAPKLGFYLARVFADRLDLHFIRTKGATELDRLIKPPARWLLTRTPAGLENSPLGVTLRHPLASAAQVPMAWPSVIRQPVRNDYPLLGCVELGCGWVRAPLTDFDDEFQRRRLEILRDDGVKLVGTQLWDGETLDVARLQRHRDRVDEFELQTVDAWLSGSGVRQLKACRDAGLRPLTLSAMLAKQPIAGKQHPRNRLGYRVDECEELDRRLARWGVRAERVLCQVDAGASPWDAAQQALSRADLEHIGAIDFRVELATLDDRTNANRAAEALFAASLLPGSRVYFDPLIDVDRTMDVSHGLLDTLCNPRPAFFVAKCLTSILYRPDAPLGSPATLSTRSDSVLALGLLTENRALVLLTSPGGDAAGASELGGDLFEPLEGQETVRVYRLAEEQVEDSAVSELAGRLPALLAAGPVLLTEAG